MTNYIENFTITVVCTILISFLLRSLVQTGVFEKYLNFIIGLIVSITLVSSFVNVGAVNFDLYGDIFLQESITKEQAQSDYNEKIAEEFKKRIEKNVCLIIEENFDTDADVDVMLDYKLDEPQINIIGIYIKTHMNIDDKQIVSVVSKELGIDESIIHIGGG